MRDPSIAPMGGGRAQGTSPGVRPDGASAADAAAHWRVVKRPLVNFRTQPSAAIAKARQGASAPSARIECALDHAIWREVCGVVVLSLKFKSWQPPAASLLQIMKFSERTHCPGCRRRTTAQPEPSGIGASEAASPRASARRGQ